MGRDTVTFESNQPVELSLAYPEGKIVPGNFGDRVMYSLSFPAQHVMFLDLGVAQKINLLEVNPGERFFICKRPKNGRTPARWDVWMSPAAESARADRERPRHPAPARPSASEPPSMIERQLAASIAEVQKRKAPQSAPAPGPVAVPPAANAPAWVGVLVAKADALIDAYAACLEHANKHGNQVKPEDVRAMLTAVYIAMTKKGASSNAA